MIFDEHVKYDGQDEKADEYVQLGGDAREGAQEERHCCSETLQHAKVLEGHIVVVGTAQIHKTCNIQLIPCHTINIEQDFVA